MPNNGIYLLLRLIDEAYKHHAWHGPNLHGSTRGVTTAGAAWRPARKQYNILEIVVHATYWKYIVRRRLSGEKKGSFHMKGSNWIKRPTEKSELAWCKDIRLLD